MRKSITQIKPFGFSWASRHMYLSLMYVSFVNNYFLWQFNKLN